MCRLLVALPLRSSKTYAMSVDRLYTDFVTRTAKYSPAEENSFRLSLKVKVWRNTSVSTGPAAAYEMTDARDFLLMIIPRFTALQVYQAALVLYKPTCGPYDCHAYRYR